LVAAISELEEILRPWSSIDIKAMALCVPDIALFLAIAK
jgi:hypothetical protein